MGMAMFLKVPREEVTKIDWIPALKVLHYLVELWVGEVRNGVFRRQSCTKNPMNAQLLQLWVFSLYAKYAKTTEQNNILKLNVDSSFFYKPRIMNHKASKESMETLVGETNLTAVNNTLGETQRVQE